MHSDFELMLMSVLPKHDYTTVSTELLSNILLYAYFCFLVYD